MFAPICACGRSYAECALDVCADAAPFVTGNCQAPTCTAVVFSGDFCPTHA